VKRFDLSLYLVLDPALCAGAGLVETALEAVAGGATMVQLRDKHGGTAALAQAGRRLRAALPAGVPLIVNDDVDAAIACGADGVHVGQDDTGPRAARARIGPEAILGVSAETPALAAALDPAVVDYAGIGPVFATATKPDHKQPLGLRGLALAVAACRVPAVAIGGLQAEHAAAVLDAGAGGLAVVSAICGTPDPRAAAARIAAAIERARQPHASLAGH
jgi:thiamine-phosphate pyrophosphorylase